MPIRPIAQTSRAHGWGLPFVRVPLAAGLALLLALIGGVPASIAAPRDQRRHGSRRGERAQRVRAHHLRNRRHAASRVRARVRPATQPVDCESSLAAATPTAVSAVAARAPRLAVRNPFGDHLFGIAAGGALQIEPTPELRRDLADDKRAGANWIRVDVNWAQIQPVSSSQFIWSPIDRVVREARRCGMHVLGTIVYTPAWARPDGTGPTYAPPRSAYARFAGEAARHLKRMGVRSFEIWNEPNSEASWTPAPNVRAYTSTLVAADRAIKRADHHATVITGGLAPAGNGPGSIAPLTFLRRIYRDGGGGHFDAVGAHPYCWPAYPGSPRFWSAWYQMYRRHNSLRSIMIAHGDGAKRIWATEFGAPTDGPPHSGFVSNSVQARMVARAYRLFAGYRWAGPLFFYQGRDAGASASTIENFFGFINYNFTTKPAFGAYQRTALLVRDALLDSRPR